VRILSVVHQANAGAGVFREEAEAGGHELVQWVPSAAPLPHLEDVDAAMVFGGEMHVDQEQAHPWLRPEKDLLRELLQHRVPVLGVCLGSQLLAEAAGGSPRRASETELGWRRIEVTDEGETDPVIGPLTPAFEAFQWHHYEAPLPPGATPLARTPVCLQAFRLDGDRAWGVQFHAEVSKEDLNSWFDGFDNDRDAVATGADPEALRSESKEKIAAQNQLGRDLAGRFFAEAERA
jgi:GMP synthase (glutamine-hydrolysing)